MTSRTIKALLAGSPERASATWCARIGSCFLAGATLLWIGSGGCVPIQTTRNVQVETFVHNYNLHSPEQAGEIFRALLGSENVKILTNVHAAGCDQRREREDAGLAQPDGPASGKAKWESYLRDASLFRATGQILITVSLSPWRRNEFFVEGIGRYLVHNVCTEELIASSDFRIADSGYHDMEIGGEESSTPVNELPCDSPKRPHIDVLLKQHVVREFLPDCDRFTYESELMVRVQMHKIADKVFTIDYSCGHQVGVAKEVGAPAEAVGCLWFDAPEDGRKLIDLDRANSHLIKQYDSELESAGYKQSGPSHAAHWAVGHPENLHCERRPVPKPVVCPDDQVRSTVAPLAASSTSVPASTSSAAASSKPSVPGVASATPTVATAAPSASSNPGAPATSSSGKAPTIPGRPGLPIKLPRPSATPDAPAAGSAPPKQN